MLKARMLLFCRASGYMDFSRAQYLVRLVRVLLNEGMSRFLEYVL